MEENAGKLNTIFPEWFFFDLKDDDYDFEILKEYNDHIVLMAYDQHSDAQSGPGPVSAQKWIEEALDKAAEKMESNKIILGIAGCGYDRIADEAGNVLKDENGVPVIPEAVTKRRIAGMGNFKRTGNVKQAAVN